MATRGHHRSSDCFGKLDLNLFMQKAIACTVIVVYIDKISQGFLHQNKQTSKQKKLHNKHNKLDFL